MRQQQKGMSCCKAALHEAAEATRFVLVLGLIGHHGWLVQAQKAFWVPDSRPKSVEGRACHCMEDRACHCNMCVHPASTWLVKGSTRSIKAMQSHSCTCQTRPSGMKSHGDGLHIEHQGKCACRA